MAGSNILLALSAAPKILYSGQLPDSNDHVIYAPSTGNSAVIKHGVICNVTSNPVTVVSVSIVPSGGAVDTTHQVISNYVLAANDTLSLAGYIGGCCLGPGDSIHMQVGTATAVNIILTGIENT